MWLSPKTSQGLLVAIAAGDGGLVRSSLEAGPALATARLARRDEFFIAHCHVHVYEGANALHAAAFAYDHETARDLVARGAGIRARDRRGAEPLHAAVIGEPGTPTWNPTRQRPSSSTSLTRVPTRTPVFS